MSKSSLAVIVHGGAGSRENASRDPEKAVGIKEALDAAWDKLLKGAPGEAAVVAGLRVLEANGLFDAGYGSFPDENGKVFLDVALMRGSGDFISLANVSLVTHPSEVALDMFAPGTALMSVWTERLKAKTLGAPAETKARYGVVDRDEDLISPYAREIAVISKEKMGTVGCVVRDAEGRIFAGTSTGGTPNKPDGRVGDSPVVGAGVYADDAIGGLSATGHGESFLRSMTSAHVLSEMRRELSRNPKCFESGGSLRAIIDEELSRMKAKHPRGQGGIIVIPRSGPPCFSYNSMNMAVGWRTGSAQDIASESWQVARRS